MKIFKIILAIFLALAIFSESKAALQIELDYTDELDNTFETADFPVFSAIVRAKKLGSAGYETIAPGNVFIVEGDKAAVAYETSSLADGWNLVKWRTTKTHLGYFNDIEIIVAIDDEISSVDAGHVYEDFDDIDFSNINVAKRGGEVVEEIHFGTVDVGNKKRLQFDVLPTNALDDANDRVRVDSITIRSGPFDWQWQGISPVVDPVAGQNPPPVSILSGSNYLLDMLFEPPTLLSYRSVMTIHYDGGARKTVPLIGNHYPIDGKSNLIMHFPNGGEILSPCDIVEIKWDKYKRGTPVVVEYSSDGGSSWSKLGQSMDSTFEWSVPNVGTRSGLIRLSQVFTSSSDYVLKRDNFHVYSLAYDGDGDHLLSANSVGRVNEWDPDLNELLNVYYVSSDPQFMPVGLSYFDNDTRFLVAYHSGGADSIAYFNGGEQSPYARIAAFANSQVPAHNNFKTKKVLADRKKQILALVPELGRQILILDIEGGAYKSLEFDAPVTAAAFNPQMDSLSIALLDGTVKVFSTENPSDIKEIYSINFDYLPIIKTIALSPDGRFAAIGCATRPAGATADRRTNVHVVELDRKEIVRTYSGATSETVGLAFSPTSTMLIIGLERQPHMDFYDLPSGTRTDRLDGTPQELTDFKVSPNGYSVAAASNSSDNLTLRTFSYPEVLTSANYFEIEIPNIEIENIETPEHYIGESKEYQYHTKICNNSRKSSVVFDKFSAASGVHFAKTNPDAPVELAAGDCLELDLIYSPLDVGDIEDEFRFESNCLQKTYAVKLSSSSKGRDLPFRESAYTFEETCVGNIVEKEFDIVKNNDPVPVLINRIAFEDENESPFSLAEEIVDTLLQPGKTLRAKIAFKPNLIGENVRDMVVYHSNQTKHREIVEISGEGIGADFEFSHNRLAFIPEILTRKTTITNNSATDAIIDEIVVAPPDNFSVLTATPFPLASGETAEIEIKWNGEDGDADMTVSASPCVMEKNILLTQFVATTELSFPTVEADPSGFARIPIEYATYAATPYKGDRPLEFEFTIHPNIFLPLSVESERGEGSILRNEIVGARRVVKVRIVGDFPNSGVAGEIYGVAGLTDRDTSRIAFAGESFFFGASTKVNSLVDGLFKLTNICGDRRIFMPQNSVVIDNISPNPSDGAIKIEFSAEYEGKATIEAYDYLGRIVYTKENIDARAGINSAKIELGNVRAGAYRIVVKMGQSRDSKAITIFK